ncbi:unnamed protein product, partial [Owenia fusiformis]
AIQGTSTEKLLFSLGWKALSQRRDERKATHMFKVSKELVPSYVLDIYTPFLNQRHRPGLRSFRTYHIPARASTKFRNSPAISPIKIWTNTPEILKNSQSKSQFRRRYTTH